MGLTGETSSSASVVLRYSVYFVFSSDVIFRRVSIVFYGMIMRIVFLFHGRRRVCDCPESSGYFVDAGILLVVLDHAAAAQRKREVVRSSLRLDHHIAVGFV